MRALKSAVGLCLLSLLFACEREIQKQEIVQSRIQDVQKLDDLGVYAKMVALETHEDALLGSITKVEIDKNSGDILIADTFVTHRVYRFSSEGRYLLTYGQDGEGPGEYQRLFTFTILDNGRVAVFSMGKRLLYESDGEVVYEEASNTNDIFAYALGNRIYVYSVLGYRSNDSMVTILNDRFEKEGDFHPLDDRIRKVPFLPREGLAIAGDQVIVSELCDYELAFYDAEGNSQKITSFPNRNEEAETLWNLSEKELSKKRNKQRVVRAVHRASSIHAVNGYLHILESHPETKLLRSNLWDLETNQLYTYSGIRLVRAGKGANYLSMNQLVGAYDNGLIGVCDDPDNFNRFRKGLPAAQGIEYTDNDNPVLLFFELKAPVLATAHL